MSLVRGNPFAKCEGIPDKDHLIGRAAIIQDITAWIQRERNLSLYGMLHIGKSSVLHVAILEQKLALQRENILPIVSNLPSLIEADREPEQFFRMLVEQCMEELDELGMVSHTIEKSANKALQESLSWSASVSHTQRFFQRVREAHIRVIFILEKFDHITTIFQQNIAPFSRLQDLSLNPACRVRFITETLHPLKEIVPNDQSISSFNKLFDHRCLSTFDEQDMQSYFDLLATISKGTHTFPLTSTLQEQIHQYCGGHPYLLVKLGYELADFFLQTGQVDMERAIQKLEADFISYIIDLKSTLRRGQLDTLVQATTSTRSSHAQENVDTLKMYGLIRFNPDVALSSADSAYIAFLPYFQDYLCARLSGGESLSILERPEQTLHAEDPFSWSQTIHPGSLLGNRYKIIERLNHKGYNQVVKAEDTWIQRFVAIKRLYLDPACGEETIKNFKEGLKREAKIMGGIKHENIGLIYDVLNDPPTIVMEWIEGKSLDQVWEKGKGLPALNVVRLGVTLAKALVYLHMKEEPVIHRDIKPQNIILQEDGKPVLIDFGIARAASRVGTIHIYDEQGNSPSFFGTPGYMAPEQFTSPRSVTGRTDIYALGVVLYEALIGDNIPSLSSHPEITPDSRIPTALWRILRTTLCQDPHGRPDALQLCQELERCLQELENV